MFFSEQLSFFSASSIKQNLRQQLVEKVVEIGPEINHQFKQGEIANTIFEATEAIEDYYAKYLPAKSLAVLIPLLILFVVVPVDWKAALIFVLTAPLIPFFMIMIGKGTEKRNQLQWQTLQRLSAYLLDVIRGLETLKYFSATGREASLIKQFSDDYRQSTMSVLRVAFISSLALEFFATLSIALIAVLIGFRLLFGTLDFETGFFVLLLAPELYLPLRSLASHYHARMNAMAAAEKLCQLLDAKSYRVNTSQRAWDETFETLSFNGVHFSYEHTRILHNIDLEVKAGQFIALVGPSGAGKSTLLKLIAGFISPQQGTIKINDQALADYQLRDWQKQLTWLPQNPRLLHATIRENLTLGSSNYSVTHIMAVIEHLGLTSLINRLPDQLDTVVGDGGHYLSGGEIQRLAIGRAMLRDTPLLLMDEMTANLDLKTEQRVVQNLAQLSQNKTVICIAHRLATIQAADLILVMDKGMIVQRGQHQELLQQDHLYRELIMSQGLDL
jgi:ATP-binding cassette subfamily C protein CydD